jgi:NADH-quinone oxidoreductase subunit K
MGTELTLLVHYLVVGAVIFGIGLIGFMARRNMIVMFLCLEMMMQGVSLSLVAWGRYHGDWDGQILVLMVIALAACEAALALALILMLKRWTGQLDMVGWQRLREENVPPHVDHEIPEIGAERPEWPSLTRAGVRPDRSEFEVTHRSRV